MGSCVGQICSQLVKNNDMVCSQLFKYADKDKNGRLDEREIELLLNTAASKLGKTITAGAAKQAIKAADRDKSGDIDEEEFKAMFTNMCEKFVRK
mmetsp:Transcript_5058/g.8307  ORF Transcript_5058/g.8307 Transcript_5058/m.8307 type:complete len:95 (-) Transcript_5058:14-298(-)